MKVAIAGSTGMMGKLVLLHCLQSDRITTVVSFVRKPSGVKHHKLEEIVVSDFENYTEYESRFKGISIVFFCLGVYTGQVPDALFKRITVDYAVEFARTLEKNSTGATMCLLSGAGADRTEKSKTSFARYKGMAENRIAKLNLRLYCFRPAYIYPVEARKEPNPGYRIIRFLYPLLAAFGKKYSIRSVELANAMFYVGLNGAGKQVLENEDILEYSKLWVN